MKLIARAIQVALLVVSGASGRVVDENKLRNHVPHGVRRLNEAGPTNASSSRTAITVDYEYQLETFDQSSTGSTIDINAGSHIR